LGYGVNLDGQIFVAPYLLSTTFLFIPFTFILCLIFNHSGRTKIIDCAYYDLMFKDGRNRDYFNIRQITAGLGWRLQTARGTPLSLSCLILAGLSGGFLLDFILCSHEY